MKLARFCNVFSVTKSFICGSKLLSCCLVSLIVAVYGVLTTIDTDYKTVIRTHFGISVINKIEP